MSGKKENYRKQTPAGIDLSLVAEFQSMQVSSGWWYTVMQSVIALLGLFGIAYSFISLFHLPINNLPVALSTIIYTVFFCLIYKSKNIWKWALPVSFVFFALAGWLFRTELIYGYKIIMNRVVSGINRRSTLNLPSFNTGNIRDYSYYVTVFVVFALFLLSMAVVFLVVRKPNFALLFLVTFPFVELGLFFGIVPSYLAFFLLLACWIAVCAMQVSSAVGKRKGKEQKQLLRRLSAGTGIAMAVITLLVSGGGYLFFSPAGYIRSQEMDDIRSDIQSFFTKSPDDNEDGGQEITASGGIGGGKLGTVDKIVYKHEKALEVNLPAGSGALYLKGYVGGVYTGNSWERIPESDYQRYKGLFNNQKALGKIQMLDSMYRALDDQRREESGEHWPVTVSNINANKNFAYIPYKSTFPAEDFTLFYDAYASNTSATYRFNVSGIFGEDSFKTSVWPLDEPDGREFPVEYDPAQLEAFLNLEKQYRDFAHDVYTRVPGSGNERLAIEMEDFYRYRSGMSADALIREIRDYLNRHAEYSLEAGRLPKGKDFVDYFLYENQKGSCSYFASAAVLMFRYGGIPARYAEGYVVTQADIGKGKEVQQSPSGNIGNNAEGRQEVKMKDVEILDTNAHAWVEIYLDGYGWTPVEVTPGFSNASINLPDEKETTTSKAKPTVTKPSDAVKTTGQNATTAVSKAETTTAASTTGAGASVPGKTISFQAEKFFKLLLLIFILMVLVIAVILVRHIWINSSRNKRLRLDEPVQCIACLYDEVVKLLNYAGIQNENNLPPKEFSEYLDRKHTDILPELFAPIMELILKAKFSHDGCTQEDAGAVMRFAKAFTQKQYASLSWFSKLSYKYIKNLYWQ